MRTRLPLAAWVFFLVVATGSARSATFPATEWEKIEKPESVGYSAAKLEALRGWLKAGNTTAMMVSVGGKSLLEYGDLKLVSKVASVRKSIIAMLYGKYVASGKIDLNKRVKQIGLDDVQPFLPREERATLEHLITARSGIYLRAREFEDDAERTMPRRGAHIPGSYFHYNQWDFNAAGTAFEKLTGLDLYDALEVELAKPIGMQDFDRMRQKKISAMPHSVHPEYAMYLSTRDMARIGLLMLRGGKWDDKEILPSPWVQYITSLVTPFRDMHPPFFSTLTRPGRWGYGVMWWVWDAPPWPGLTFGPFDRAYAAFGANGQFITVLPALDMVVAHKVNIDETSDYHVTGFEFQTILQMVISANCGSGRDCWQ